MSLNNQQIVGSNPVSVISAVGPSIKYIRPFGGEAGGSQVSSTFLYTNMCGGGVQIACKNA